VSQKQSQGQLQFVKHQATNEKMSKFDDAPRGSLLTIR